MATFRHFIFVSCLASSVLANAVNVQEDLDFTKCATNNQELFIKGIKSIVDTSDPLSVDLIPGHLPDFKYQIKNGTLKGLKDCIITKLRANKESLTFDYNLECPRLEFQANYFLKGQLSDMSVEGQGDVIVKTGIYVLMFHGYYKKNIGEDKKEHAHIDNYSLDFEAKEKLVFKLENLRSGDKEKSEALDKFVNENWSFMDKQLRAPVLYGFMDVFIQNLNKYLNEVPIIDIFKTSC